MREAGTKLLPVHCTPPPLPPADHISTFRLYQALTQRIQALYRDCTAPTGTGAGAVLGQRVPSVQA